MDICTSFLFESRDLDPEVWRCTHLHIVCEWPIGLSSGAAMLRPGYLARHSSFQPLAFKKCPWVQCVIPSKLNKCLVCLSLVGWLFSQENLEDGQYKKREHLMSLLWEEAPQRATGADKCIHPAMEVHWWQPHVLCWGLDMYTDAFVLWASFSVPGEACSGLQLGLSPVFHNTYMLKINSSYQDTRLSNF